MELDNPLPADQWRGMPVIGSGAGYVTREKAQIPHCGISVRAPVLRANSLIIGFSGFLALILGFLPSLGKCFF